MLCVCVCTCIPGIHINITSIKKKTVDALIHSNNMFWEPSICFLKFWVISLLDFSFNWAKQHVNSTVLGMTSVTKKIRKRRQRLSNSGAIVNIIIRKDLSEAWGYRRAMWICKKKKLFCKVPELEACSSIRDKVGNH